MRNARSRSLMFATCDDFALQAIVRFSIVLFLFLSTRRQKSKFKQETLKPGNNAGRVIPNPERPKSEVFLASWFPAQSCLVGLGQSPISYRDRCPSARSP